MTKPLPQSPRPLLARLCAPPGPPPARWLAHGDMGVMAVPGRYCVSYLLVSPDAVALVDAGSAADTDRIRAALDWLGRPIEELRAVIPSHLHFDHVMGLHSAAARFGARLVLGRVADEIAGGLREARWPVRWKLLRAIPTWVMQGAPAGALADWVGGWDYGFPGARNQFQAPVAAVVGHGGEVPGLPGWRLYDTPGHSDCSVCLHHEESGFLVAGDTVRNFLGGEWNPLLTDAGDFARTRELLSGLRVRAVFPGHGPILEGPDVVRSLRFPPPWAP